MNKKLIVFFLALIVVSQFSWAQGGRDFQGHWAENQIQTGIEKGWIRGYEDGNIRPDSLVTRAEFASMVNNMFGLEEKAQVDFGDVGESDWFYDDVAIGIKAGYIKGYEDSTFRPYAQITRQEAMAVVYRMLQARDMVEDGDQEYDISDYDEIGDWARGYVRFGFKSGIVSGYEGGYFRPQNNITRAEAMVMLFRSDEYMEMERERERERDMDPEDADQDQEREREQEHKDDNAGVPQSSYDYRTVYMLDKWVSAGDVYVRFDEYDEGVFEVRLDEDIELEQVDEERPYIVRIRRGQMELIKDEDSSKFDSVYGVVTDIEGDIMRIDTTPGDGDEDEKILNASGRDPLVYEEDDEMDYSDIDEGDYIWVITQDTARPNVIEILTDEELSEDKGEPPYTDGY